MFRFSGKAGGAAPMDLIFKMVRASGCDLNMAAVKPDELPQCLEAFRLAASRSGAEMTVLTGSAPGGNALLGLLVKVPSPESVTKVSLTPSENEP